MGVGRGSGAGDCSACSQSHTERFPTWGSRELPCAECLVPKEKAPFGFHPLKPRKRLVHSVCGRGQARGPSRGADSLGRGLFLFPSMGTRRTKGPSSSSGLSWTAPAGRLHFTPTCRALDGSSRGHWHGGEMSPGSPHFPPLTGLWNLTRRLLPPAPILPGSSQRKSR